MVRTTPYTGWIPALLLALAAGPAAANTQVAIDEVLARWQGDAQVQFVELRLLAANQNQLNPGASLVFFDATGSDAGRRTFTFQGTNPPNGAAGARVLIGTSRLQQAAGIQPDYVIEPGVLHPDGGRVCYVSPSTADCLAYGDYKGDNTGFGRRERRTPDNRSLQRVATTGDNRDDFDTVLSPTPQRNAGQVGSMPTLCGNEQLSQGEECDGALLGGETCESLGFAKGKLACDECHFDTSGCTLCGNDEVDKKEECDGDDLDGKTCPSLGFVDGTLACTDKCLLSTDACSDTFHVPGGGPPNSDCVGEWRILNGSAKPGGDGKTSTRQRCRDGDASCDGDTTAGQCTFSVAVCFSRDDARLAKCDMRAVEAWSLLRPTLEDRPDMAQLVTAVAAAGTSATTGASVTFNPAIPPNTACTEPVAVTVPIGPALTLRARTTASGGRPRDTDVLKLQCRR